jgi:ABC-type multidrug transport system permease subunit
MFGAFANLTELPVASEARNVVAKQIDAGFFPSLSYTLSVCLMHLPITIIEALIFGTLVYFMPGFTYEPGRYFFFLFLMFLNSNAISVFFRSISYVAKNPDIARQMDLPFIVIFVIFGGQSTRHSA